MKLSSSEHGYSFETGDLILYYANVILKKNEKTKKR